MSKVIVTGASGFIGSNLVRKLIENGDELTLFLRKNSNTWRLKDILQDLNHEIIDFSKSTFLTKKIQEIRPEYVYHLGAYGGYPFQNNITETLQTNLMDSINLMNALVNCDSLKYFVNAGSSSEYGPKNSPMKETDSCNPITPYGISKLAQTLFAKYFSNFKDLPTVTFRFFSAYGPYEEKGRLISDIMISLLNKSKIKLSSPSVTRDFIFVEDVISALLSIRTKKNLHNIINIGTGVETSIEELIFLIQENFDSRFEVSWGNIEKKRDFDIGKNWVAETTLSKQQLNWKAEYSLKEGLEKTLSWFRKNINLYD